MGILLSIDPKNCSPEGEESERIIHGKNPTIAPAANNSTLIGLIWLLLHRRKNKKQKPRKII
jgi:hypothetical protein